MTKVLQRKSNMELLRIVAMMLVLIVHSDFFTLGIPTQELCKISPGFAFGKYFFQSISIVCVNVFILISGWFGIKPNWKSFLNFLFQCLFFSIGIYIVCIITGLANFSIRGIAECFFLTSSYWFIKAYIGLYIFAPMINAFIENKGEKDMCNYLLAYFTFQTVFAWLSTGAEFLIAGLNTLSFIGLYTLARFVRLYPSKYTTLPAKIYFFLFFLIAIFSTIITFILTDLGIGHIVGRFYTYVNPIVILASLTLMLAFTRLDFKSKFINWIACSCFAVYLLHVNPNVIGHFCNTIIKITQENTGIIMLLYLFVFLLFVFIISILIDKLRIYIWTILNNAIERRK